MQKLNKKQKRKKKQTAAAKAAATRQSSYNYGIKRGIFDEPQASQFAELVKPKRFYLGCLGETLGSDEASYINSWGEEVGGMDVFLSEIDKDVMRLLDGRIKELGIDSESINLELGKFVVGEIGALEPKAVFDSLDEARAYAFSCYPSIKVFRNNRMGLVDVEEEDFCFNNNEVPSLQSSSVQDWVDYYAKLEETYGAHANEMTLLGALVSCVYENTTMGREALLSFYDTDSTEEVLSYASSNGLNGVFSALDALPVFADQISKLSLKF